MKKKGITGYSFYKEPNDYIIRIFESATVGYYHVIIDSAFQDNEYFHLTKEQVENRFKGIKL